MSFRSVLLGAAAATLIAGAAAAAPSVVNSNFSQGGTGPSSSGITGWTVNGYAGVSAFNVNNQWNNGTATAAGVGFLSSNTDYSNPSDGQGPSISQAVSGFTVGDQYQITILANARAGQGSPVFTVSVGGTSLYSGALTAVDAPGAQTRAFTSVAVAPFTATSSTLTITLGNAPSGAASASTLLAGISLADLGPAAVPEPLSAALLGSGLAGLALVRRRRA